GFTTRAPVLIYRFALSAREPINQMSRLRTTWRCFLHFFHNCLQYRVRRDILRLSLEAQHDAVPHRWQIEPPYILEADVVTSFHEPSHLRRQDERLRPSRTGAAADELVRLAGRELAAGVRRHDEANRVVLHWPRHEHVAHQRLPLAYLVAMHDTIRHRKL